MTPNTNQKRSPTMNDLPGLAAQHEAGHAIAGLAVGWDVAQVRMVGFDDGDTDADPPEGEPEDWRDYVTVLLAGGESEELLGIGSVETCNIADERAEALDRCRSEVGDADAVVEYDRLKLVAAGIVSERRPAIEALVRELLRRRTLGGEAVRAIVESV